MLYSQSLGRLKAPLGGHLFPIGRRPRNLDHGAVPRCPVPYSRKRRGIQHGKDSTGDSAGRQLVACLAPSASSSGDAWDDLPRSSSWISPADSSEEGEAPRPWLALFASCSVRAGGEGWPRSGTPGPGSSAPEGVDHRPCPGTLGCSSDVVSTSPSRPGSRSRVLGGGTLGLGCQCPQAHPFVHSPWVSNY